MELFCLLMWDYFSILCNVMHDVLIYIILMQQIWLKFLKLHKKDQLFIFMTLQVLFEDLQVLAVVYIVDETLIENG